MIIKENQDIEYDIPGGTIGPMEELELDISKMFLVGLDRESKEKLRLDLKTNINEKKAWVIAKNISGEKFLDLLEKELREKFIGKNYSEIISNDFQI